VEHEAHEVATQVVEFGGLFLIPLFPLIGAAINAILGYHLQKRFGRWAVHTIALAAVVASFGAGPLGPRKTTLPLWIYVLTSLRPSVSSSAASWRPAAAADMPLAKPSDGSTDSSSG